MQRYNLFYMVHKGLREMLYTTASRLQQIDFTEVEETEPALTQVQKVLFLFDKHANTEDDFALTAIEAYEPSVVTLFEEEHVQDHELSNRMRSLLIMFQSLTTDDEKLQLGSAIRAAFTEFLTFNLKHMAKEESVLNNLLWRYYSDEELQGITQKIIAQIPADKKHLYSTSMMRALSNNEITNWLKEVKNNAPEFVFNSMLGIAEKELPEQRLFQVLGNISEGAMLA
jgi:hemerythrin-like domain-containing protein